MNIVDLTSLLVVNLLCLVCPEGPGRLGADPQHAARFRLRPEGHVTGLRHWAAADAAARGRRSSGWSPGELHDAAVSAGARRCRECPDPLLMGCSNRVSDLWSPAATQEVEAIESEVRQMQSELTEVEELLSSPQTLPKHKEEKLKVGKFEWGRHYWL